jgi:Bacterial PH domain
VTETHLGSIGPIDVDSARLTRRSRTTWAIMLVIAVLVASGATATSSRSVQVAVLILCAVLVATCLGFLVGAARLRVRIDDEGIRYRGAIRTLELPWDEVSTVGWLVFPRMGAMPRPLHMLVVKAKDRRWPIIVNVTAETLSDAGNVSVNTLMARIEQAMEARNIAYSPAIPNLPEPLWGWILIAIAVAVPIAILVMFGAL